MFCCIHVRIYWNIYISLTWGWPRSKCWERIILFATPSVSCVYVGGGGGGGGGGGKFVFFNFFLVYWKRCFDNIIVCCCCCFWVGGTVCLCFGMRTFTCGKCRLLPSSRVGWLATESMCSSVEVNRKPCNTFICCFSYFRGSLQYVRIIVQCWLLALSSYLFFNSAW